MAYKRQKYGNIKTRTADGILHDSRKEAQRWRDLLLLERAGEISGLRRQVKYVLIPKQTESFERYSERTGRRLKDGERTIESECSYIADFVYVDSATGKTVVEDSKGGVRTKEYRIKKKLMLFVHGIKIRET